MRCMLQGSMPFPCSLTCLLAMPVFSTVMYLGWAVARSLVLLNQVISSLCTSLWALPMTNFLNTLGRLCLLPKINLRLMLFKHLGLWLSFAPRNVGAGYFEGWGILMDWLIDYWGDRGSLNTDISESS
jgi:hypothetical protein